MEENDAESPMPPQIDVSVSHTLGVFSSLPLILYAQISSPVDPALLSFKLNKLQQAQNSHHADVPDETEEEQEPDSEEQIVMEVDEAEPMVAEVSRIVISGTDDTINMELAFQENERGSRNDNSNNANFAGEDEGKVQQNPCRHAVRIEERLEALLESKLNGFREEVRTLRAEGLSTGQALQDKTSELLVLLSHLMDASGKTKKLVDEEQSMIATNSDPQVKVQAEKDIMLEHISSKIDQLRAKVDEIQVVMLPLATSRSMELDETPSQSSSQFKKSDVTIESKQERPENLSRELEAGDQALVSEASPVRSCSCVALANFFPNRCILKKRRPASRRAKQTRRWIRSPRFERRMTRKYYSRAIWTTFGARTTQR